MIATTHPTPAQTAPHRIWAVLVGAAAAWGIVLPIMAATVPVVSVQQPPVVATITAPASPDSASTVGAGPATVFHSVPRTTILAHDGSGVLFLAALPLLVTLVVGLLLWLRTARASSVAGAAAWMLSSILLAAAVVGFVTFLIGIAVVPSGVLLVIACAQAASPRAGRGPRVQTP